MITESRLEDLTQTGSASTDVTTIKSTCTGTCSDYGTRSSCPPLIVIAMLLTQLNAQRVPCCCAR
jgi:predicted metal-binding protein